MPQFCQWVSQMSLRAVCGVSWICVLVFPGLRTRAGGVQEDSSAHSFPRAWAAPLEQVCPWWGLEDLLVGTKATILHCFPSSVFKLELSWCNLNLFVFVIGTENSCWLFFSPQHTWRYFFQVLWAESLICSLLCVVLGSLLWALIFATNLILQVDVTLPDTSHSAEQTGNITLPVLQAILH